MAIFYKAGKIFPSYTPAMIIQKKIAMTSPALYLSPVTGFSMSLSSKYAPANSPTQYKQQRTKLKNPTKYPSDLLLFLT